MGFVIFCQVWILNGRELETLTFFFFLEVCMSEILNMDMQNNKGYF